MRPLLLLALLATAHLHALSQFEGTIQSKNRSVDDAGVEHVYQMTIWVKKAMVRVQVPAIGEAPAAIAIYRRDRKVSWMLDEGQHTYFEIRLSDDREAGQSARPSEKEETSIQRTKRTRKLLGFTCEQVILTRGEVRTEIWGARGLDELVKVLGESLEFGQATAPVDLIASMGLFPLLSTTAYEGRTLDSQEITKIERKSLDPALFEIPAGYSKQKAVDVE
jgi:hypothetical protein